MLEPEEIDNYFNASGIKKAAQDKPSKHTRRVMLAKLALPGLAAVLAITLLVFPSIKKDIRDFALDFAIGEGDIEKMNVEKTTIYMTDSANRVNNLSADFIKETAAGSKIYNLTFPEALLPLDNKEWVNIRSPQGIFNQQSNLLHLKNRVEAFYSKGMTIQTDEAFFDFKKSLGYSKKPVSGTGFIGDVSSEGFEFSPSTGVLTFLGKTNIIINEASFKKE